MSHLPIDLWLEISNFTSLPYCIHTQIPVTEKWQHLRTTLPPTKKPPSDKQTQLLWRFWNYSRYAQRKVIPAIKHGLDYPPLLQRYVHDLQSTEEYRIVSTLLKVGAPKTIRETLLPAIRELHDSISFDKEVEIILTQALLYKRYNVVSCVMNTLAEHEDEPYGNRMFALHNSLEAFINQHPEPITGDELEKLLDIMQYQNPEDPEYFADYQVLPTLVAFLYGTQHKEFLARTLALIRQEEYQGLLYQSNLIRQENLSYFKFIIAEFGERFPLTVEIRRDLMVLLYGVDCTEAFYVDFFNLFYQPGLGIAKVMAAERIIRDPGRQYGMCTLARHQRMLRFLVTKEGRESVLEEFAISLKPEWNGAALGTLIKELVGDSEEGRGVTTD